METAIGVALTIYKDQSTFAEWQNFFIGKTINGFAYVNFNVSEILMNRSADEGGVTIELPATQSHLQLIEDAISGEYLCQVWVLELPTSDLANLVNFDSSTIVSRFLGEIVTMETDLTTLAVSVGAAIDAVSGDIPGRKITTSLVGRLPSL